MKRILVVNPTAGNPDIGPNTRWYYLGEAMSDHGYETYIIGSSFFHKYVSEQESNKFLKYNRVNYFYIKTPGYKKRIAQVLNQIIFGFKLIFKMHGLIKTIKPDTIVFTSPHPFAFFACLMHSKINNIKLIYEVRDLWPLVLIDLTGYSKYNPYFIVLKIIETIMINSCDKVISVKEGDLEYFMEEYGDKIAKKFTYIPNGFYSENISETTKYNSIDRNSSEIRFCYIGSMTGYYDLGFFLNFLDFCNQKSKNIIFDVIGDGEMLSSYKELATQLGIENIINFHGRMKRSDAMKVASKADWGVLSLKKSKANEYGISCNKLFEYMSLGLPVLGNYYSRYDPIKNYKNGFNLHNRSFEESLSLIESANKRELSKNSIESFNNHHEFKKISENLKKVL